MKLWKDSVLTRYSQFFLGSRGRDRWKRKSMNNESFIVHKNSTNAKYNNTRYIKKGVTY